MTDDGSRSKLVHLLQPIRSLSDNWDVNIAAELEEYLEELEELTFSFEGGPSLNFAEAALVIQGSACIYGRKVEYLHSLVYRALEVIADNKRRQNRARGGGGSAEDDGAGDPEADFLCLDSLVEVGTSIDLDEDVSKGPAAALRPPPSLLALEDAGGNSDGTKGGEDGVFKISYCHVHPSGALLLEQQDLGTDCDHEHRAAALGLMPDEEPGVSGNQPGAFGSPAAVEEDYGPGGDGDDNWEPADDGGDPEGNALEGGLGLPAEEEEAGLLMQRQAGDGQPLDPAAFIASEGQEEGEDEEFEEPFDPYRPLDMYDASGHKPKPFRRMRARKLLPPAPQQEASGEKGFFLVKRDPGTEFFVPAATVSGCTYPEFGYILEALRAAASRKPSSMTAADQAAGGSCFTAKEAMMHAGHIAPDDEDDNPTDDWEPPEDDGEPGEDPLQDWGGDDGGEEESYWTRHPPGDLALLEDSALETLTYEELCKAHIDKFIAKAAKAEVQTELASRVAAWQSKMEPMLEIQNSQGAFDIHEYGERILCSLSDASSGQPDEPCVGFGAVVTDMEKHQVSRAFSAMLQLINNGNVAIHREAASTAPFMLELVTTELAHKQMGISGALGFQCNGTEVSQVPAGEKRDDVENMDANLRQASEDEGRSPLPKAARTAAGASRGGAARTRRGR